MAFCIADAFICLCPHNPHTHWRWTKREWHFIQQNTYSNNNWRIENIIFLVAITHTHSHNGMFLPKCGCLSLWHLVIVIFVAILFCRLFSLLTSSFYFTLSEVPLIAWCLFMLPFLHHIHTIALSHSRTLTLTNWLEDSFAIFSILFVLLFLDYCSVILAVCGVIARISYNCIALEQHTHFAPTVFFSILVYIVFLLFALCLHTIQHLFSLFLISYPYFVRCLFQFVWAKLHVELAQKNIWKSDGIPKCFCADFPYATFAFSQ